MYDVIIKNIDEALGIGEPDREANSQDTPEHSDQEQPLPFKMNVAEDLIISSIDSESEMQDPTTHISTPTTPGTPTSTPHSPDTFTGLKNPEKNRAHTQTTSINSYRRTKIEDSNHLPSRTQHKQPDHHLHPGHKYTAGSTI